MLSGKAAAGAAPTNDVQRRRPETANQKPNVAAPARSVFRQAGVVCSRANAMVQVPKLAVGEREPEAGVAGETETKGEEQGS